MGSNIAIINPTQIMKLPIEQEWLLHNENSSPKMPKKNGKTPQKRCVFENDVFVRANFQHFIKTQFIFWKKDLKNTLERESVDVQITKKKFVSQFWHLLTMELEIK